MYVCLRLRCPLQTMTAKLARVAERCRMCTLITRSALRSVHHHGLVRLHDLSVRRLCVNLSIGMQELHMWSCRRRNDRRASRESPVCLRQCVQLSCVFVTDCSGLLVAVLSLLTDRLVAAYSAILGTPSAAAHARTAECHHSSQEKRWGRLMGLLFDDTLCNSNCVLLLSHWPCLSHR